MERKLVVFFSLIALFGAFGAVSLLVIITKRHPFFIEKKLRIGAVILSLSGFAAGCNNLIGPTCYSPALPEDAVFIDQLDSTSQDKVIHISSADTLTGSVRKSGDGNVSFAIRDTTWVIRYSGDLLSADGTFDSGYERFRIVPGSPLETGEYSIEFYCCMADSISASTPVWQQFKLTVTD